MPKLKDGKVINAPLLALNQHVFSDLGVENRLNNANLSVDKTIINGEKIDGLQTSISACSHGDWDQLKIDMMVFKL